LDAARKVIRIQGELSALLEQLSTQSAENDESEPPPFTNVPDRPNHWYAVWVDPAGAAELSAVSPEPVRAGIIYAGECVTQSARRHLMHNNIGSFTLMKNIAALLREEWALRADRRGDNLVQPGRQKLLDWMSDHLTATVAPRRDDVRWKDVLTARDPPLRLEGWRPDRTDLRRRLTAQRAIFDENR